jgi:hypothetical protein
MPSSVPSDSAGPGGDAAQVLGSRLSQDESAPNGGGRAFDSGLARARGGRAADAQAVARYFELSGVIDAERRRG